MFLQHLKEKFLFVYISKYFISPEFRFLHASIYPDHFLPAYIACLGYFFNRQGWHWFRDISAPWTAGILAGKTVRLSYKFSLSRHVVPNRKAAEETAPVFRTFIQNFLQPPLLDDLILTLGVAMYEAEYHRIICIVKI